MNHLHSYIALSGPWPTRHGRYVLNAACSACREPREVRFSTTRINVRKDRARTAMTAANLAALIARDLEVRFASAEELAEYHAKK